MTEAYAPQMPYSLYSWRVNPPYEYPQSTMNTPYNESMRDCLTSNAGMIRNISKEIRTDFNWSENKKKEVLEKCRLNAVKKAYEEAKKKDKKNFNKVKCSEGNVIENFMNFNRSLPSVYGRYYQIESNNLGEDVRFCFYN